MPPPGIAGIVLLAHKQPSVEMTAGQWPGAPAAPHLSTGPPAPAHGRPRPGAERRLGEMMAEQPKAPPGPKPEIGLSKNPISERNINRPLELATAGIDKNSPIALLRFDAVSNWPGIHAAQFRPRIACDGRGQCRASSPE